VPATQGYIVNSVSSYLRQKTEVSV